MSNSEEVEYEVEYILCARVEKKRGRKKALVWKYKVRWKGYQPEDDTWEPEESFSGSNDVLQHFWERAKTNGRDHKNINLFEAGEEFLPVGPPRRKRKLDQPKVGEGESTSSRNIPREQTSAPPEKRQRIENRDVTCHEAPFLLEKELQKSAKTPSPSISTSFSPRKPARKQSVDDEIIPPSDEEVEQAVLSTPGPSYPSSPMGGPGLTNDDPIVLDIDEDEASGAATTSQVATSALVQAPSLPFHQHRAANPLVRLVQDPLATDMENAIAVKVRLMGGVSRSSSSSPRKNKPGVNVKPSGLPKKNTTSLLTFDKGELKTVKGRYRKEEGQKSTEAGTGDKSDYGSLFGDNLPADEIELALQPEIPPTAGELLKMAGVEDIEVDQLEEYEDEAILPTSHIQAQAPEAAGPGLATQDNVSHNRANRFPHPQSYEQLFPARVGHTESRAASIWKSSTIFGPLGIGFQASSTVASQTLNELTQTPKITLTLDPTLTLPIMFKQLHPSNSPLALSISHEKGPPGKFYLSSSLGQLLDSLRTGELSAKAALDVSATGSQQACFEQLCYRLRGGDIFMAMLGSAVLAFCASNNSLAVQRLNIHPSLISSEDDILVSQVIIEDFSVYAEAALTADNWHSCK